MRILIEITHPCHYHFYKNVISELKKKGHNVLVTARDKDVLLELLKKGGIDYLLLSEIGKGKLGVYWEFLRREMKLLKVALRFKPDVITGIQNPGVAHVAWLLGKRSVVFSTSEHQRFMEKVTLPFVTEFITHSAFNKNVGKKQKWYDGYHELAYLHPKRFRPNRRILKEYGLNEKKFIILRLVSWQAHHDVGQGGIKDLRRLVKKLENVYPVYITSEMDVPEDLKKHVLKVPVEKIHSVLSYAALYVGEGAAMAAEAAVLGTPAIYTNTIKQGYMDDLERYGLLFNVNDSNTNKLLKLSNKLLKLKRAEWKKRKNKMLGAKMDVVPYVVDVLEGMK